MCAINSFTCRVKMQMFGSLVRQDIGFFETIKTGKSNAVSMVNGQTCNAIINALNMES